MVEIGDNLSAVLIVALIVAAFAFSAWVRNRG
jgi:hypothetical protein